MKIDLKKEYQKKIKDINQYNKFYFDKNKPKISDANYDKLKKEILEIEKKYPDFISKNSPSVSVGFKPSKNFEKSKHRERMLSLSNFEC